MLEFVEAETELSKLKQAEHLLLLTREELTAKLC